MKKKKVLIGLLVLLALAIWAHNLYRIFIGVARSDQEMDALAGRPGESLPDTVLFPQNQQQAFVYSSEHRDPFAHWRCSERAEGKGERGKRLHVG